MRECGAAGSPEPPDAARADPHEVMAALRERGAQGFDPVRFCFIEALGRRAAAHEGEARQLLEGKLARALQVYEQRAAAAGFGSGSGGSAVARPPAHRTPLAGLLHHLAQVSLEPPEQGGGIAAGDGTLPAGPAELKTLRLFRGTWARLGADLRLTQSAAKVPENAGPLNSHAIAIQALKLMSELSPSYLQRFMSHVDALLWLEQANGSSAGVQKDVVHAEAGKPRKAGRNRAG